VRRFPPGRSQVFFLSACFAVLFAISPHCAQAQDLSASDLLKKIAETYRHLSTFSVAAERRFALESDASEEHLYNNTGISGGPYLEHDDIEVTLMASSSSKAKLLLKDGKTEIVVVRDGKVLWTLIPAQQEYTEVAARSPNIVALADFLRIKNNDISGMDLLGEYEYLLAARFRDLSSYESRAKLEHSETLKVGKDKKQCYVLTIRMAGGSEKHKLWVDKKEFNIWKSVDTSWSPLDYQGIRIQTTLTVTAQQFALNPSLDESNFVFTLPDQAKRVDWLKLSGRNPF